MNDDWMPVTGWQTTGTTAAPYGRFWALCDPIDGHDANRPIVAFLTQQLGGDLSRVIAGIISPDGLIVAVDKLPGFRFVAERCDDLPKERG